MTKTAYGLIQPSLTFQHWHKFILAIIGHNNNNNIISNEF